MTQSVFVGVRVASTLSKQRLSGVRGDSFIYLALTERLLYAPRGTRRPAEHEAHGAPPQRGQLTLCRWDHPQITHISPIKETPGRTPSPGLG